MKYAIPLVISMMIQSTYSYGQKVEIGTSYWINGVVTHNGSIAKVTANEPRPLRQAVESLSEEYGWNIDYEDPVYSDAEAIDRTDPAWTASHPGVRQHLIAGHSFASVFPEVTKTGDTRAEKRQTLEKIVADYNKSGNPGQFMLIDEGANRFAIVGQTSGKMQTILDTPITLNVAAQNGSFALDAFAQALTTSSGIKVTVLTYPLNLFVQTLFTTGASNQPAREVLRDLVDATHRNIEWMLLYDIDDKAYYLNLIAVVKATADASGEKRIELVR